MKKILLILLAISFYSAFTVGKERTKEEKLVIASQVADTRLATRGKTSAPLSFIKETDTYSVVGNKMGFVVISNDDNFDAIIAYSDINFEQVTMNPAMDWYFRKVSEILRTSLQNGNLISRAATRPTGDYKAEIPALCASVWAQDKPFNSLCPTTSNGKAYPSGCVATALSQIMFYYQYPIHGIGSHQYSFTPATGDGRILSWDFANTTLDWDNMLCDYSENDYTETQANAVAELMAAVGVSVDMQYSASGSGAFSKEARYGVINYWGYNENLNWLDRNYYSTETWMKYIYEELNCNRPIYYTGDDASNGGHAFVIDGYDKDGLVHVNWGWGPNGGNGYYDIALLNPSGLQFSEGQDMLIGISPTQCLQYQSCIYSTDPFSVSKVSNLLRVTSGLLYNHTGDNFSGEVAVILESSKGIKNVIKTFEFNRVVTYYYLNPNSNIGGLLTLPTPLEDGEYRVYLASKCEKDTDWRLVRRSNGQTNSYMITIANGKLSAVGDAVSEDSWATTAIYIPSINPQQNNNKKYNLLGQPVLDSYKGPVIINGKKVVINAR